MNKVFLLSVALAAISASANVQAQSTATDYANGTVVFSSNMGSLTFNNAYTSPAANFTTTTGTQAYNQSATVDPSALTAGAQNASPSGSTRWAVYKQAYSVVIGNVSNSGSPASYWFIHDIVGQNTPSSALPTSGSYTYTGKTVWHDVTREGDFTYTINLASRTGSGAVTNMQGGSGFLAWTGSGTLNSAAIAVQSDGTLGVKGGTGSFTTNNVFINATYGLGSASPTYDLALFGPNAEEIAGAVKINSSLGSFGLVGTR